MPEWDAAAFSRWEVRFGAAGLRRVVETLSDDVSRLLGQLRDSVVRDDAQALAFAAHALKPPCAMFGSPGLADLCQELEDQGSAGVMTDAAGKAATLALRFEALVRELKQELAVVA